jgi:hypothetical protein
MLIDINNSGTGNSYLCDDCRHHNFIKVKSKYSETFCKCPKWGTSVSHVGVCKYYEQEIAQDVDFKEKV